MCAVRLIYIAAFMGMSPLNAMWDLAPDHGHGANRMSYQNLNFAPNNGANISRILSAFGQNAHALADFYAHTSWVDANTRGGCVLNKSSFPSPTSTESGFVPNRHELAFTWRLNIRSRRLADCSMAPQAFRLPDTRCAISSRWKNRP